MQNEITDADRYMECVEQVMEMKNRLRLMMEEVDETLKAQPTDRRAYPLLLERISGALEEMTR